MKHAAPSERTAHYNFRYFLPYSPQWGDAAFCQRRLDELLAFCRKAHVDCVQFFVNTLPGTYYMPAFSAEDQAHWAAWMKQTVAPAIRAMGVSYQLNFQMLLGVTGSGVDLGDRYGWQRLVDQHGNPTDGAACPICPVFREKMGAMIRLWASTEPDALWIDDDFRLHNHGQPHADGEFYCYCPLHLAGFEQLTGRPWTVSQLVADILQPGSPSQTRHAWLDYLGRTMTDTARWIREQTHAVSPSTRLALMTSLPAVHAAEGRDWRSLLDALSGPHQPLTRPCSTVYAGTTLPVLNNATTHASFGRSMAILRRLYGADGVDFEPELENTRFTTWSKSVANSRFVLILGQLLGAAGITLSLNDLDGSPIMEEPTTVPLLRDSKPRLDALAALELSHWSAKAVALPVDPRIAHKIELNDGGGMQDLVAENAWDTVLLGGGVPVCYPHPDELDGSYAVAALDAAGAWALSDAQLDAALRRGVLLDGEAAWVIQQRGRGEALGVVVGHPARRRAMAEAYAGDVLTGVHACRVPHRGERWRLLTLNGARATSHLIDAANDCHIGSTVHTNRHGGRIAIFADVGTLAPAGVFWSHARMRWLRASLCWLGQSALPVLPVTSQHGLSIVLQRDTQLLLAHANLATDSLHRLAFHLHGRFRHAYMLDGEGHWNTAEVVPGSSDTVVAHCSLAAFEWLILRLEDFTSPQL